MKLADGRYALTEKGRARAYSTQTRADSGGTPLLDLVESRAERDAALKQIAQAAEDRRAEFHADACACVLAYLEAHGPTSGETLTIACKESGIVPHDDRAFGPVYMALARSGAIVKVGEAVRRRGHGTSGGNVWARVR